MLIICPLCNLSFKSITNSHLMFKHNITTEEFLSVTGLSSTVSLETIRSCRSRNQKVYDSELLGKISDLELASILGVNRRTVTRARQKQKIPPPQSRYRSVEGLYLRSTLEAMYDKFLHESNIPHEHEVNVPHSKYVADFLILGCLYVEVCGMEGMKSYEEKILKKEKHFNDYGLDYLLLTPTDVWGIYKELNNNHLDSTRERKCSLCCLSVPWIIKGICKSCYAKKKSKERIDAKWRAKGGKPPTKKDYFNSIINPTVGYNQFCVRVSKLGMSMEEAVSKPNRFTK